MKLIIGPQPPVLDIPPQDAQNRFQLVFPALHQRIRAAGTPAMFLDDLQRLDVATLDKAVEMTVNFYAAHRKGWAQVRRIGDQG